LQRNNTYNTKKPKLKMNFVQRKTKEKPSNTTQSQCTKTPSANERVYTIHATYALGSF
jgi:hypothetical protein